MTLTRYIKTTYDLLKLTWTRNTGNECDKQILINLDHDRDHDFIASLPFSPSSPLQFL